MNKLEAKDFVQKYNVSIIDKMVIVGYGTTYTVRNTLPLLEMAGFEFRETDPYDDFEYYIQSEIAVDKDNKITLLVGDNYDTKEWELVGDLTAVNKLIEDYNNGK